MIYKEYKPAPELSQYIKCYWSLESEGETKHSRERVFPDGCIELIFHYGDLFRKYTGKNESHIQSRSFIHGQLKKFIELEATGKIGVFSARFYPSGLQHFIDFGVDLLTDKTMDVVKVWTKQGTNLEKEILSAGSGDKRKELLEKFLLDRLSKAKRNNSEVEYCVNSIVNTNGNIVIEELADSLHIGKRQLERKFVSGVGLTPKYLARIVRFNKALQLIEARDFSSFTSVAHEGGFYDQAHFIKDFKELTGLNPKKYFSENLEMVKFFNL